MKYSIMHFWPWNSSISDDRALSQSKLSFVYLEPKSSHSTILVRVMGAESVCSGQTVWARRDRGRRRGEATTLEKSVKMFKQKTAILWSFMVFLLRNNFPLPSKPPLLLKENTYLCLDTRSKEPQKVFSRSFSPVTLGRPQKMVKIQKQN